MKKIMTELPNGDCQKARLAKSTAAHWLNESPNFLDTETTGLGVTAQVIEVAVYDSQDNAVFYSKLKPSVDIDERAEAVHGISMASLADAPTWPEIAPALKACLINHPLVIFNRAFDIKLLQQTAAAFADPAPWIAELETHCAMYLAADCYGSTNRHGSISLSNATAAAGVKWRGEAHGAQADTLATVDLVKAIAGQ